ncbi:MAG TPA: hypothetical protein VLT92_06650 [Burkholderiales bacterium]|nr:hypothetical protein [Burkholderiales bacterium]
MNLDYRCKPHARAARNRRPDADSFSALSWIPVAMQAGRGFFARITACAAKNH